MEQMTYTRIADMTNVQRQHFVGTTAYCCFPLATPEPTDAEIEALLAYFDDAAKAKEQAHE